VKFVDGLPHGGKQLIKFLGMVESQEFFVVYHLLIFFDLTDIA